MYDDMFASYLTDNPEINDAQIREIKGHIEMYKPLEDKTWVQMYPNLGRCSRCTRLCFCRLFCCRKAGADADQGEEEEDEDIFGDLDE